MSLFEKHLGLFGRFEEPADSGHGFDRYDESAHFAYISSTC